MTGHVHQSTESFAPEAKADIIGNLWDNWDNQRSQWKAEKRETRNFIFATDTSKTSVSGLPWKNSTTLPKLTQIRDNLHANYMAALFPNDNWLKWKHIAQMVHSLRSVMQSLLIWLTRLVKIIYLPQSLSLYTTI